MNRTVHCQKLDRDAEGLAFQPYPGELGRRIFENISKPAWDSWLNHQTMLINEYRLSLIDEKARQFLEKEMENYFFGDGGQKPEGFVNPEGD